MNCKIKDSNLFFHEGNIQKDRTINEKQCLVERNNHNELFVSNYAIKKYAAIVKDYLKPKVKVHKLFEKINKLIRFKSSQKTQSIATTFFASFAFFAVRSLYSQTSQRFLIFLCVLCDLCGFSNRKINQSLTNQRKPIQKELRTCN